MDVLPLRLVPGDDLRRALEAAFAGGGHRAGFVLSGIGSLSQACLRHAGMADASPRVADLELLTLAGSLSPGGSHLHATVADARGRVSGGHVAYGCIVRTTAEVLVGLPAGWTFDRQHDPCSGYHEWVVRRASPEAG